MTDAVLLDTHFALWLDSGNQRLRPSTRGLIDAHWRSGGTVFINAGTAWQIALLVDTGRIELDSSVETWIDRFLDRTGVEVVPLSHRAACRSYQLHHQPQRDPADRPLIPSAIELGCPLLTYDERIVGFAEAHSHQFSFTTVA